MIMLTFPAIAPGETAICARGTGPDAAVGYAQVGYCARVGGEWTAVLYARRDDTRFKTATLDRRTLAELRNVICGRLEPERQVVEMNERIPGSCA